MSHPPLSLRLAKLAAAALLPIASIAFAQNAAVVNNKPIPKQRVDDFVAALVAQGRPDTPELRAAVRDELIARELFVQEAEKKGLPRNADVQRQLDNLRQDVLIRALIRDYLKANPVKDEEIKAEYEKVRKQAGDKEYRARHILVESEDDAKQIIEQLKKGAKFEELAKKSRDTGSAQSGGDLDWNTPQTFVKEFSDAMVKLDKGKFTETPVKTQFGYHVIRLDDTREAKAPPLEELRPQIQQEIERQRVQALQQSLRAKAKIQ
ncbi:MAG: peptidylprolyl isomerase [Lautropia sp.]|nr:peptidylprolyl isomerase [Lautropia sp.]MCL4700325.1 peptidylprolyl isomerase [Burkholderiaceae bacterium]MDL1906872.1 peptidylprolyl isomerase [Betaproteobacteria bacterium PRO1]RIK90806.1 MAG: peptidylprolyl isomerase [Burkholderiales bacterium]